MDKIILTTGGTGGHIFPALATAQALKRKYPAVHILFMGSIYGPEYKITKQEGIDFIGLPVKGIMGKGFKSIPAFFRLAKAMGSAIKEINNFKPDAIAGFGGYASFAPILAARFLKIPILLHEQNAIPGASTRILSRFANKICVSLPDTKGLQGKPFITGNPVRENILQAKGHERKFGQTKRILVIGGSQGAHGINEFIKKTASRLVEQGIEIWHQTGEKDYEEVSDYYNSQGLSGIKVEPFIKDMGHAFSWADLAFCRSGATTIAELCVMGLPAVFVPFPAAIHDHQTLNALSLSKKGACEIIQEHDLDEKKTIALINELLNNPGKLKEMSCRIKECGKPDAAEQIVNQLEEIIPVR